MRHGALVKIVCFTALVASCSAPKLTQKPQTRSAAVSAQASEAIRVERIEGIEFLFMPICLEAEEISQPTGKFHTAIMMRNAVGAESCDEANELFRSISRLDLSYSLIEDLTPLEGLPVNVKTLNLQDNFIRHIEVLAKTRIENLTLDNNRVFDLSPLSKLNIKSLIISGNPVNDFSFFESLTDLRDLVASSMRMVEPFDPRVLSKNEKLEVLILNSNRISEADFFVNLPNLKVLHLRDNRIVNISPLVGIENLEELKIIDNPITTISPIADMKKIELLGISSLYDTNLEALRNHPSLRLLQLFRFPNLVDISALVTIPELTELFINASPLVTSMSSLVGLNKLEILDLSTTSILDLEELANFPSVKKLSISDFARPIENLEILAGLNQLEDFTCIRCRLTTLEGLEDKVNLRSLHIPSNRNLVDISALKGLTKLEYLIMGGAAVEDLSPLAESPSLRILNISFLEDYTVLQLGVLPELIELQAHSFSQTDFSFTENFPKLAHLGAGFGEADLSTLRAPNLISISLQSTYFIDLEPLANFRLLESVDLTLASVLDLTPLASLQLKSFRGEGILFPVGEEQNRERCPVAQDINIYIREFCLN